jgi:hypothetical protein
MDLVMIIKEIKLKNNNLNIFDSFYNEAKARKFRKSLTKEKYEEGS